jgi:hypothetical protein
MIMTVEWANWPLPSQCIVNFRISNKKKWYKRNCPPWKWSKFKNSICVAQFRHVFSL